MNYGPIELLVIEFPGSQFSGEITPALEELVQNKLIRIIDILFVQKHENGEVTWTELSDLVDEIAESLEPVVDLIDEEMLTEEDAMSLAAALSPGSSAGVMMFENLWANRFANAVVQANGRVVLNERVPRSAINELIAQYQTSVDS